MLLAFFVVPLIARSISPGLNTVAMLEIIFPVSFVFSTVNVGIDTVSVRLVILPFTLVDIAISVIKSAVPICFVIQPETDVLGSVRPLLGTFSIAHTVSPLARVNSARWKSYWTLPDARVLSVDVWVSSATVWVAAVVHAGCWIAVILGEPRLMLGTTKVVLVLEVLAIDGECLLDLILVNFLDCVLVSAGD